MKIFNYTKFLENKNITPKLKLLMQPNAIFCGPTALQMIAQYFGIVSSINELAIVMGTDEQTGTTDTKMKKGLEYLSLEHRRFKVGDKDYSYKMLYESLELGHIVLFRALVKGIKHWVCCDGFVDNKFNIKDSWLGEYDLTKEELENIWGSRGYDGFVVEKVKSFEINDYEITPIQTSEINEVVNLCSTIFSNLMSYEQNVEYIKGTTDFTKSVKLTVNGELAGCYLIKEKVIEEKDLIGKVGLEGIALAIKPAFRKYGLGEKLKDWLEEYGRENGYDYIMGWHFKGLNNIHYWLKRRELWKEDDNFYWTIKRLKH